MPNLAKGLRQAYDAQDAASQSLSALQASQEPMTTAKALAIAQLVLAIDKIQDRIRIHRNKPLPGTVRPTASKPSKRARTPRVIDAATSKPGFEGATPAEEPSPAPGPEPEPTQVAPEP